MSELMTPEHTNLLGKVFGGAILSLLDKVAYVTASRFAGRICVTASFDRVDFHSPIEVGELVHCVGRVIFVGRTSLQIGIEVYTENLHQRTRKHTNSCAITMVAIDEAGKPSEVPILETVSIEDKRNFLIGKLRKDLAVRQRNEFKAFEERIARLSIEELDAEIEAGRPPD